MQTFLPNLYPSKFLNNRLLEEILSFETFLHFDSLTEMPKKFFSCRENQIIFFSSEKYEVKADGVKGNASS